MERWADILRALLISLAGGIVCKLLNVPLPWMLGPLFAMALARIFGVPAIPLAGGRQSGQLIIGCALGQYFTPEVGRYVAANSLLIVGSAFAALVNGYVSAVVLARISKIDMTTAFFSSLPGGASEMVVLADRYDAKAECVAISHSIRVLMVVVIIPFAIIWSGAGGSDPYQPMAKVFDGVSLVLLISGAVVCAFSLQWYRVPNAWMFGPLFLSMALTLMEIRTSAVPQLLTTGGQILIGCSLGSRFAPDFLRQAPRFVKGVVVSVFVALLLAGILAICVSFLGGMPIASAVLATSPGGIAEMCITAKVLRLGVPLVTSYHLTRLLFVLLLSSVLLKLAQSVSKRLRTPATMECSFKDEVSLEREDNG